MKIDTKSLHYRLYHLTYSSYGGEPPLKTSLCQYVRRLAFALPLLLLFGALFFLGSIFIAGRSILAYPLGYSTNWKTGGLRARSPGLFQVHGVSLYSGYLVLPIALVVLNAWTFKHIPSFHGALPPGIAPVLSIMVITFEAVALIFGAVFGIFLFFSSDAYDLLTEWIDAKTQGVCPLVEFEGDDDGDQ